MPPGLMKDVDELYEELLENFKKKGYVNPKAMLDYALKQLIEEGRTRGQAILYLSFHPEDVEMLLAAEKQTLEKEALSGEPQTADEQRVKELEEKIARLTVLFSKGEIGEGAYKTALRTLEKELEDLRLRELVREQRKAYSESVEPVEEVYERRFSTSQRFLKLLTSPSEAMKDIASSPSYEGIAVFLLAEFVLSSVLTGIAFQKFEFSGPYSSAIIIFVTNVLVLTVLLAWILLAIKWVVKSYIVKYACDDESGWNFKTAASITGYAYVPTIIISIIGIPALWFLVPTFHIDTTSLDVAERLINDYQAQIVWFQLLYGLPLSLFGLMWKSYLGGLGAHFGTQRRCSLGKGIVVFFALGLISYLVSLVLNLR